MPSEKQHNLFGLAESCLFGSDLDGLLEQTHQARRYLDLKQLGFNSDTDPKPISHTVFPDRPVLMMPKDMPRRGTETQAGQGAFFHALAHIEFVAIYLAWDIIYRFRGLPEQFYIDWLIIADEEATHFEMLRQHLRQFNTDYGDLPAHSGLWWHARETEHDILARLAIVPRCMEARGLDVTPSVMAKFAASGDQAAVAILQRIYEDEVGHVERGSFWFNTLAKQAGLDPEQHYKDMLLGFYKGKPKGPFNREVRLKAGFTAGEIDWLEEGLTTG